MPKEASYKSKKIIAKRMILEGCQNKIIANYLKVHPNTVSNWKYNKKTNNKKKRGRHGKLSQSDKITIKNNLYQNYNSSIRKTTKIINDKKTNKFLNKTISHTTVQNYVKSTNWGKKCFKRPKKPLLSNKNINSRVSFGKFLNDSGYLGTTDRSKKKRSKIVFSDETYINIRGVYNSQNMRYRTENIEDVPPFSKPKFDIKIMVAGAFCAKGKSKLVFFENGENINSDIYIEKILPNYTSMINSEIFDNKRGIVFQQDGAPAHTSRDACKFLADNFDTIWGKNIWPGNSPDLSPIENLWSILKEKIILYPYPKSTSELKKRINDAWDSINNDVLEKLAESFKDRILEMLKKHGRTTSY